MKKQKKWISIMVLTAFLFSIVNVPVLAAEFDSTLQTAEQSQTVAVSETEENTESIDEALTDGSETITGNTAEETETFVEETETSETVDSNIQQISTETESTATDTAATSGTCGENVTWELVDGVLTISGTGEMNDYESYTSAPWYKASSSIQKIVIRSNITSIGDSAFSRCSSLKNITIPDSVISIGDGVFERCDSLTNITIPNSVTSIGSYAFASCSSLKNITIPNSVISIGDGAFASCSSLTNITIPDGVTSIADYAFESCDSLTNITIPNSVTSIGYYAFASCSSLTNITIPNSVTSIGHDAFKWCSSLTNITIPNSVTSIAGYTFRGCSSLTNITIPDGVTSIGYYAFASCSSLTNITIPNSVTSINYAAFYSCKNLTIYGFSDSYAETYANDNNIPFIALDNDNSSGSNGTIISMDNPTYHCAVGGLTRVSASVIYPNGEPEVETFSWSVSDTDVVDMVTVLPTAFQPEANVKWIEGLQPGECTITVRTSDGAASTAVINVTENIGEVEAQNQFIDQHLAFKNGSVYADRMTNGRWGQILDEAQNTAAGNTAEAVYHIINSTTEILSCQALSVFENPYDAILADLVLNQKDFEYDFINRSYEILDKYQSMLLDFCELNGESVDTEFRTNLEKLILDPKSMKETNPQFYTACNDLFGKYKTDSELEKILNVYGKSTAIWNALGNVGSAVDWVVYCVNFNAQMEAFLETTDIYKEMLMSTSYFISASDTVYGAWYLNSLERYFDYMDEDKRTEIMFEEFVSSGMNRASEIFGSSITKGLIAYFTEAAGLSTVAPWVIGVVGAIDSGWAMGNAVTDLGNIMDCRELIRANKYLEDAMYQLTEHYAYEMETRQDYMSALHYDQAYTLLKAAEIYSLNTYNEFLDRQQSGFVQSILHGFRPYNAAEIEQGVILIAQWENANCHVASKNFEDLEVQQLSYTTLGLPARTVAIGTENAEVNVDIGTIKLSESCNVYIHDKTGKLLYSIENGEVTCDSKGINGSITEGVIVIADCDIENHMITFEATKDGAVDYVLTTFDENADMTQTTAYEQLPVKENSVYVSDYDNSTNEVSLTDSQGEPLIADVKTNTLVPIETVELTVQKEKLEIGEITSAQVVVKPSDATCKMGAWSSSDELIATVDGEGKITAIAEGTVTIRWTATDGSGVEKSVVITVNNGKTAQVKTTSMYRLYNPNSGEHFYTGSIEERDNLVKVGWQYEGVAWNAPTQTGDPVYRLFNPNNGDHHYTMSAEERDNLVAVGWRYEGVCWNSASPENLPLYRLYNPNADCGSHHYTGSTEERDFLVSLGWHFEGIGWFGMLN